jgi:hypothetical protein
VIVLRLTIAGRAVEHRLDGPHTTLGSGPRAGVRRADAGWPPLAATLLEQGSEVRLVVPGRAGTLTLRVGDTIRLGEADVALIGLLPAAAPPTPLPTFGDYDEPGDAHEPRGAPTGGSPRFVLEEPAPRATTPPPAVGSAPASAPARPAASPSARAPAAAAPATASAGAAPPTPPPGEQDPFSARLDFDAELYAALRKTPWVMASVILHLFVFLLFWLTHTPEPRGLVGKSALTSATVAPPGEDRHEDEPEVAQPFELPPPPEVETPAPEIEPDMGPSNPELARVELDSPAEPAPVDPTLGTMPSLDAASKRTAPRRPVKITTPKTHVDLHEEIAKDNVHEATRKAARVVKEQLGKGRGGAGDALKTLVAEDILVVQGEFDHQERVLRELGIEFVNISPHDPRVFSGEAFRRPRFVFWNCGHGAPPRRMARLAPSVRAFVERGGYLFTSDWVLGNLLTHAFPGYVDTGGPAAALAEMVITIEPTAAGRNHPLLEGVFQPGARGRWWLEQASHDIVVKRPNDVTVLIDSPDLKDMHVRSNAMAFTFDYGRGRVLHTLGHYYQEQGNIAGAIAAQRIALNFVLLGLKSSQPAPQR